MTISRVKTWTAEILTHTDLNAEFDNIINNLTPANIDDLSATLTLMRTTNDPSSPTQATTLEEEIQQLRYQLVQITGKTYWYEAPASTIAALKTAVDAVSVITNQGDIIRGDSSNNPERLALGSSGYVLTSDGTDAAWDQNPYPQGHLFGGTISRNSSNSEDLDIAVMTVRDSSNGYNGKLSSALTKQTDATWASGTNAGGMASGLSATVSTWYHVHALIHPTTQAVDIGFDTSVTASHLLADSNVSAAGYTKYRRIGSILLDSSGSPIPIVDFLQKGDDFTWDVPSIALNTASTGTSRVALSIDTPPDVECLAYMVSTYVSRPTGQDLYMWVRHPDQTDVTPSSTDHSHHNRTGDNSNASSFVMCYTDTSSQIAYRYVSDIEADILLHGWKDSRGRLV